MLDAQAGLQIFDESFQETDEMFGVSYITRNDFCKEKESLYLLASDGKEEEEPLRYKESESRAVD